MTSLGGATCLFFCMTFQHQIFLILICDICGFSWRYKGFKRCYAVTQVLLSANIWGKVHGNSKKLMLYILGWGLNRFSPSIPHHLFCGGIYIFKLGNIQFGNTVQVIFFAGVYFRSSPILNKFACFLFGI